MTYMKSLATALTLITCFYQNASAATLFPYTLENYGVKAYESTIKGNCTFNFITPETPLAIKQDLAMLNTHQQRILALTLRVLNRHIKIKKNRADERWGLYCNIGTNHHS